MTPQTAERLRGVFDMAMALPPEMRREFVERHLATSDPVRAEVLGMLGNGDDNDWLGVAADLEPRKQIGRYTLLKPLAPGGMGDVHLAFRDDEVFHKVVALKTINDTCA